MTHQPTRRELQAAAALLERLASEHGLANLRLGHDPGEVVADLEPGRTYFDVVAFEGEVESRLGWRPALVPSGAPDAQPGEPLAAPHSAA